MESKFVTACAAALLFGAGSLTVGVQAQDLATTGNPPAAQGQGDMATRVKSALHADPGLFDKHIDVSSKNGKVVLNGFVATAQDLQKAVKIGNQVAGEGQVVNNLTIKEGGGGGSG